MSSKVKICFKIMIFLGLFILVSLALLSIIDSYATNIVSAIPPSILGASLFIGGIIGYVHSFECNENKKDE